MTLACVLGHFSGVSLLKIATAAQQKTPALLKCPRTSSSRAWNEETKVKLNEIMVKPTPYTHTQLLTRQCDSCAFILGWVLGCFRVTWHHVESHLMRATKCDYIKMRSEMLCLMKSQLKSFGNVQCGEIFKYNGNSLGNELGNREWALTCVIYIPIIASMVDGQKRRQAVCSEFNLRCSI